MGFTLSSLHRAQRGIKIMQEYTDRMSGAKARQPGLDQMMAGARRGRFDVVLVWAYDRIARSAKHYLEMLDELNRLNIEQQSAQSRSSQGKEHPCDRWNEPRLRSKSQAASGVRNLVLALSGPAARSSLRSVGALVNAAFPQSGALSPERLT